MSRLPFDTFFNTTTGASNSPYGCQCRLACGLQTDLMVSTSFVLFTFFCSVLASINQTKQ
jgi:hypothetical protein